MRLSRVMRSVMNTTNNEQYYLDVRKEHRNLCKAFAGVIFVLLIGLIMNPPCNKNLWLILTLFCISIPSSIASINIERATPHGKKQNSKTLHFFSFILMYVPATLGITLLVWSVSNIAGVTFATTCVAWFIAIVKNREKI